MVKNKRPLPFMCVTLSDVHVGSSTPEQLHKEFFDTEKGFFAQLNDIINTCKEELEANFLGVFITGDFFDRQISVNSNHAKLAMDIMNELVQKVIVENDSNVILLRGTRSHDLDQLKLFEHLSHNHRNFHIVETVKELTIDGIDMIMR